MTIKAIAVNDARPRYPHRFKNSRQARTTVDYKQERPIHQEWAFALFHPDLPELENR
jgi:hypothetical protein